MTAASLGLLVAECVASTAAVAVSPGATPPPLTWRPVWDTSVHASLPALRVVRQ